MKIKYLLFILLISAISCSKSSEESIEEVPSNPAADGFNANESDSLAMAWADATMMAMGGREAWDNLNVLSWNFFGSRDLIWEKTTGRVRIDFPRDSSIYLLNINSMEGKVLRNGAEITNTDSLSKYLTRAKNIWINDSYWLVMPFKLKDSGVILKYVRSGNTETGTPAEVLELTFESVGVTPNNKYEVFIDKSDSLIKQWAYFRDAAQDSASAIWPWDNYQSFDGLLLSSDRSDGRGPSKVKVYDNVPDAVFDSFDQPDLN